MSYPLVKLLHLVTVAFNIGFFLMRYFWMLQEPTRVQQTWVRIISVSNDTLLLIAGIALVVMSHQYPLQLTWLNAKLIGLLFYIILGSLALKRGRTRSARAVYGILALICVGYIVVVARYRTPTPWM